MLHNVIEQALARSPEYKKWLDEETALEAAKRQRLVDQASQPLREANTMQKKLFAPIYAKPLPELQKLWSQCKGNDNLAAIAWNVTLKADRERIEQDAAEADRIFTAFLQDTLPKNGWVLSPAGAMRLTVLVAVAVEYFREVVSVDHCWLWHRALAESGCYDDATGEASYSEPARAPEPPRQPTLDDIDAVDDSTPEGRLATKELLTGLANTESLPLANLWFKSLSDNYSGFCPTEDDWTYICALFQRMNWSPLDPKNYDAARRHMVSVGKWSSALLTHDDLRSHACEVLSLDRETRHVIFNGSKEQLVDLLRKKGCSLA